MTHDLLAIRHLAALQDLDLAGTRVGDVNSLANLPALKHLDLTGTRVTNVLQDHTSLRALVQKGLRIVRD